MNLESWNLKSWILIQFLGGAIFLSHENAPMKMTSEHATAFQEDLYTWDK